MNSNIYQLWEYGNDDVETHQKIAEGDIHELELMKKEYDIEATRTFLIGDSIIRDYYIRKPFEPSYQIYNIDYKGIARKFRTVYNKDECDRLVAHLNSGHKKYNTKMQTIVIERDDTQDRGEERCQCCKCAQDSDDEFNEAISGLESILHI